MSRVPAIGLVNNARSERNRRGMADLEPVLRAHPEIVRFDFTGPGGLREIARDLGRLKPELIVINGGDGTVQGLLTELLEERPLDPVPPIAILPRGMANMTAADCGLRRRGPLALERLITVARRGLLDRVTVRRHVLRVAGLADGSVQRGMFLGAAGITDAIRLCKSRVHSLGFKGELAHLVTLTGLLWGLLRNRRPPGMLEGEPVAIRFEDGEVREGRQLLLLATTLDRLVLASRPFWNCFARPFRFTAIRHPPPGIVRRALSVLYGGDRRALPEDSYFSRGGERVELELEGEITIDGQFYRPEPGRPLVVTAPDRLRFVRL
ncbi:MAG: acylglycerol kinase family protein [Geminicoccaceae bacterium]|nr:acylglycerol kinase family protein [Geminicoccaceae bacterium]MDW8125098.1 acylglycerol kinase family protein [Geminicoccaceae bacterium]